MTGTLQMEGVIPVLPTPFLPNGEVDGESLSKVVKLYVAAGATGLVALGVTSEAERLSESERGWILDLVLREVGGAVPVICGVAAPSLKLAIDYTIGAADAGAAAVLLAPPKLDGFASRPVLHHYSEVATQGRLPIVVQSYREASGFAMEPTFLARLVQDIPNVCGVKLEDAPTAPKINRFLEELVTAAPGVMGGLGGKYLLQELSAGASGAMTGFAFPERLVEIVRLFRSGALEQATDAFNRCVPLLTFEFQPGIGLAIRKEILRRRGIIKYALVREPGSAIDGGTSAALDSLARWYERVEGEPLWTMH